MVKLRTACHGSNGKFESVVILDSGKTSIKFLNFVELFESVVILDSGKTSRTSGSCAIRFESVVILDSGKTNKSY